MPNDEHAAALAAIDARLARIEAALLAMTTNGPAHPVSRARARAELRAVEGRPVPPVPPVREYLTTAQAADILRTSPATIRRMIRRGDLAAVPIGYGEGRPVAWRIPADALSDLPPVIP
jgi:excisionase family DNA binding protein